MYIQLFISTISDIVDFIVNQCKDVWAGPIDVMTIDLVSAPCANSFHHHTQSRCHYEMVCTPHGRMDQGP